MGYPFWKTLNVYQRPLYCFNCKYCAPFYCLLLSHTIMPTTKTQVVIAGAGPTGLSMAAQLLRYGIDFIIIEKKDKPTPLSKAIVVQARTLEIFSELGIAEKAISLGQLTTAMNLFYKGKQRAFVDLAGLGQGLSPFPFALSLEQSKTEKLLVDHLSENGKLVQWGSELIHIEQNENGITAYYKDSEGQEQKLEADFLVGCDGAGSLVRHQCGLSFEGDTVPKLFYVADVQLRSAVINKNELFMFLIKKGFILFFPMEGERHYRIVGILPDAEEEAAPAFADIENSIKQQVVSPLEFEEVSWFSTYKVHSRKANSFARGRCFIAGDAAHIHTPAGGQGMNTGIQDAYNLAWKLAFTIRGEVKEEVLKTYNAERTENAKHLLESTDRMFDIMAGASRFGNFIRLYIFPAMAGWITKSKMIKRRIFPLISQTGISYPNSFLSIGGKIGKVSAGDRMPYFVFADGTQVFDYLSQPDFKVLYFGNDNGDLPSFNDVKFKIITHAFKEIPEHLFGKATGFYILLRPDNHIVFIGDMARCGEALKKITAA
jgi:2-polyprenyl-6-methoxyphenol hydroxylase-like FAD-dependent oxidoreductase